MAKDVVYDGRFYPVSIKEVVAIGNPATSLEINVAFTRYSDATNDEVVEAIGAVPGYQLIAVHKSATVGDITDIHLTPNEVGVRANIIILPLSTP